LTPIGNHWRRLKVAKSRTRSCPSFFYFVLITLGVRGKGLNIKDHCRWWKKGKGCTPGTPSSFARFRAGSKMRRSGRVYIKRAFVVNTFYVRSLLYRSLSARVKCQKISDSLVIRARSLDLRRVSLRRARSERNSHRSRMSLRRNAAENKTPLLYNSSKINSLPPPPKVSWKHIYLHLLEKEANNFIFFLSYLFFINVVLHVFLRKIKIRKSSE